MKRKTPSVALPYGPDENDEEREHTMKKAPPYGSKEYEEYYWLRVFYIGLGALMAIVLICDHLMNG